MGLENNSNAIYLSISNGKICRRVSQKTDTSIQRTNKENKEVHEEFYDAISGHITAIDVREHPEYGKFWNVTVSDGTQNYILQFKYSSGYASAFLKQLPNVDFDQMVKLVPKLTEENGKKKTTLFVNQYGAALKHFFTKDNPNGLPQLKQVKVKGQITWDDTEMMEFFENYVEQYIRPKLSKSKPVLQVPEAVEAGEDDNNEPLPF